MKISEKENDVLAVLMGFTEVHKVTSEDVQQFLYGTSSGFAANHIIFATWAEKMLELE